MKLTFHISGKKINYSITTEVTGQVFAKKKIEFGSQPKYLIPESLLGEINILRRKMSKRHS